MTEARDLLYSASGPHHHGERRDAFSATSTPQPKRHTSDHHFNIINWKPINIHLNVFPEKRFREKVPRHFHTNFVGQSLLDCFLAGNYYIGFYCFAI